MIYNDVPAVQRRMDDIFCWCFWQLVEVEMGWCWENNTSQNLSKNLAKLFQSSFLKIQCVSCTHYFVHYLDPSFICSNLSKNLVKLFPYLWELNCLYPPARLLFAFLCTFLRSAVQLFGFLPQTFSMESLLTIQKWL